jgi:tRNA G18 (ribose-2'-O)-methylase SpoU
LSRSSLSDSRLDLYRNLNQANLTRQSGRFIVEGWLLVERLLASGWGVESVVASEDFVERVAALAPPATLILELPRPEMKALVGFDFHRGVLACGRRRASRPLAELLPLGDAPATVVVCPEVSDPENLGSILRSAAAFGVQAAVLGSRCADPFSRRVVRTSMGTVFALPIVESRAIEQDLATLRDPLGCELVATVLDASAESLPDFRRVARTALLFGNEAAGLEEEIVAVCQRRVTLPMRLGTDSLNVSVAAGIFLYHFCR